MLVLSESSEQLEPSASFRNIKHATYRSGGLLFADREQEIGKTVKSFQLRVPFF
jgi:hypothetical protein